MAKGFAHLGALALIFCAALWGGLAAHAQTSFDLQDLRLRMAQLNERLQNDPAAQDVPLAQLLQQVGLPGPKLQPAPLRAAAPIADRPARSEMQNLRLALAILAQSHGGKDNGDVTLAQGPRGLDALTFRDGTVTLDDLRAALQRHGLPPLRPGPEGGWLLDVPVILWEDTEFRLAPGERLILSRASGAFVLSFGLVQIAGARLEIYGDENIHAPDFRPFLAVGGGGALRMTNAKVNGLGFGLTGKFSGVAVAAHPLMRSIGDSVIRDNVFRDMMTVSVTGSARTQVADNRFFDMRHNALLLSGAPSAQVTGNLFFGAAVTNAVRVLNGSSDVAVIGNYIMGGDRAAIIVEGGSARVSVRANVMANRSGGGIKFFRSHCGVAEGNVILDMGQKGVEVRTSRDTTVHANLIAGNRSAGIWVSAQPKGAVTHLSDNILLHNDSGINTATGGTIYLDGNDLTAQMPRLVRGDIALQNRVLVQDLRGVVPVRMTAGTAEPEQAPAFDCGGRS